MTSISCMKMHETHLISLLQGLENDEVKHLFNVTLPKMVKLVLDTPKICTEVRLHKIKCCPPHWLRQTLRFWGRNRSVVIIMSGC